MPETRGNRSRGARGRGPNGPSTVGVVHLLPLRLEAELSDAAGSRTEVADLEGTGQAFGLGPLEVDLELHDTGLDLSLIHI